MGFGDNLINGIKNTESQSDIKEEISDNINESKKILNYFKNEYGEKSKEYKHILKEHIDLKNKTNEALIFENQITKDELGQLQKEFNDVKTLENWTDTLKRKSIEKTLNSLSDILLGHSNKDLLEYISYLSYIVDIKKSDIKNIESLLNKNPKGNNPEIRLSISNIIFKNIINIPGVKRILNTAQEKLIKETIGNNGYNQEYIQGYNNKIGNHIIEISNFVQNVKNIPVNKSNSLALANYLLYITESKSDLNKDELLAIFGKKTIIGLAEIWNKDNNDPKIQITKRILEENGLSEIVDGTISLAEIIKNPEETIPKIKKKDLPTEKDFQNLPSEQLKEFNAKWSESETNKVLCPQFKKNGSENISKFNTLLSISKTVEIKNQGEENFSKDFLKIIDERIKNKNFSKNEIKEITEKANIFSKELFKEGLDLINNPKEACGFSLAIFVQNKSNEFLESVKLEPLTEENRISSTGNIAQTHLDIVNLKTEEINSKIKELENKSELTQEKKFELKQLKEEQKTQEKRLKKAKQILLTSQATDKEIEEFNKFIEKGGTKEDAFQNFENKRKTNTQESQNSENISSKYTLNTSSERLSLESKTGEKIEISNHQAKMIEANPEIIDIVINLNTTLIKVGLANLIQHIDRISNAIGTTGGLNNNDKSLQNNEIQKFLNSILLSVGEKEIQKTPNLKEYVNAFNQKNEVQVSGNHKDNLEKGSSKIEEIFMRKYITGFSKFQTNKFKQEIKKNP